jgi:hypothetical protein
MNRKQINIEATISREWNKAPESRVLSFFEPCLARWAPLSEIRLPSELGLRTIRLKAAPGYMVLAQKSTRRSQTFQGITSF